MKFQYSHIGPILGVIINDSLYSTHIDNNANKTLIYKLILEESENVDLLIRAIQSEKFDIEASQRITQLGFNTVDDIIYYRDRKLPDSVQDLVQRCVNANVDTTYIQKFIHRLYNNVSKRAIEETHKFLQNKCLPITIDGRFIGYKSVTKDFKDHYTKKIDNSPGAQIPRFERNQVDDNPNNDCSYGYHIGSKKYASSFHVGSPIIACIVDPADIICVPYADCGKVRVTYYEPIKIIKEELNQSPVYNKEIQPIGSYRPEKDDDWSHYQDCAFPEDRDEDYC